MMRSNNLLRNSDMSRPPRHLLLLFALMITVATTTASSSSSSSSSPPPPPPPPASMKLVVGDTLFEELELLIDPFIGPLVQSMRLPNESFVLKGVGALNVSDIRAGSFKMDKMSFQSVGGARDAQWIFSVNNVLMHLDMNYHLVSEAVNITGAIDAEVEGATLDLVIGLQGNSDGRLNATVLKTTLSLGKVVMTFSGDDAKLMDLLAALANSLIVHTIEKDAAAMIGPKLDGLLALILNLLPTSLPLYDFGRLYFGLVNDTPASSAPAVTATPAYTTFGFALEMEPLHHANSDPSVHHVLPDAPIVNGTSAPTPMLGVALDDFVLNSIFYTTQEYLVWHRLMNPNITTTTFAQFIPDLNKTYPGDVVVSNVSVDEYPLFTFDPTNGLTFSLPVTANMSVLTANNTIVEDVIDFKLNLTGALTAKAVPVDARTTNLTLHVETLHLNISAGAHKVDPNVAFLNAFVNAILGSTIVGIANMALKPMTLPSYIQGVDVGFGNGFVQLALSVDLFGSDAWLTTMTTPREELMEQVQTMQHLPRTLAKQFHEHVVRMYTELK